MLEAFERHLQDALNKDKFEEFETTQQLTGLSEEDKIAYCENFLRGHGKVIISENEYLANNTPTEYSIQPPSLSPVKTVYVGTQNMDVIKVGALMDDFMWMKPGSPEALEYERAIYKDMGQQILEQIVQNPKFKPKVWEDHYRAQKRLEIKLWVKFDDSNI